MIDEGLLAARKKVCRLCPHNRFSYGWGMGHCCYDPGNEIVRIKDDFMQGPDTNCPVASWTGLAPLDLEALAAQAKAWVIEDQKRRLAPVLVEVLTGLSDSVVTAQLQKAVAAELLEPEAAVEAKLGVESRTAEPVPKK